MLQVMGESGVASIDLLTETRAQATRDVTCSKLNHLLYYFHVVKEERLFL